MSGVFLIPMPFAAGYFAWTYLRPRTRLALPWYGRALVFGVPAALLVLFAWRPGLLWTPGDWHGIMPPLDEMIMKGPLVLAMHAFEATAGVVALLVLRRALKPGEPLSDRATALVGAGLFVPAACVCAIGEFLFRVQNGWLHAGGTGGGFTPVLGRVYDTVLTLQLLVVVVVVVTAVRAARGPGNDATSKKVGRIIAGFTTATVVLALAIGLFPTGAPQLQAIYGIWAFWNLVGALLVAYGIVRFQVFDIDLRIKAGLGRAVVGAAIGAAVFVGSELIERAFAVDQLLPALAIAGGATLAVKPLSRVGQRFADRVMPRVADTPAYRAERARDVYRAAFERFAADGGLGASDRSALQAVAAGLGLDVHAVAAVEAGSRAV